MTQNHFHGTLKRYNKTELEINPMKRTEYYSILTRKFKNNASKSINTLHATHYLSATIHFLSQCQAQLKWYGIAAVNKRVTSQRTEVVHRNMHLFIHTRNVFLCFDCNITTYTCMYIGVIEHDNGD